MDSIAGAARQVIGGVDTHLELHHAAVVDRHGEVLGVRSFATTRAGYRAMLGWFREHGELVRVGVEQSGSFGAGRTRHLALAGVPVLEVTGPDPAMRRVKGKDDTLDAITAAKAALTGQRVSVAKDRAGHVEALRVLRVTRTTAVKCRRATLPHRPAHPQLRHPPPGRRQEQARDHQLPQALRRPRDLPRAHEPDHALAIHQPRP